MLLTSVIFRVLVAAGVYILFRCFFAALQGQAIGAVMQCVGLSYSSPRGGGDEAFSAQGVRVNWRFVALNAAFYVRR